MSTTEARALRLVGAAIAAFSGCVLVASLFVGWYSDATLCEFGLCPPRTVTGWHAFGAARFLLLAVALAGAVPLTAEWLAPRARVAPRIAAALLALGGALFVAFRLAAPPSHVLFVPVAQSPLIGPATTLLAGPFIAFVACAGVAGGALLSGIGHHFFARARSALAAAGAIAIACAAIVVAPSLPWIHQPAAIVPSGIDVPPPPAAIHTGFSALGTLSLLLVLGALATAGGAVIAAVFRWRAVFLALAVAGWLEAAFTVAGTPNPNRVDPFVRARIPVGYAPGYYVCLGAAGIIVLVGVSAALAGRDG
jgi:hypothetical protein